MKATYLKIKENMDEMIKNPEFSYVQDKIGLVSEPSEFYIRNKVIVEYDKLTNEDVIINNFIVWIEIPVFSDVKRYDFNGTKDHILNRIIEIFEIKEE